MTVTWLDESPLLAQHSAHHLGDPGGSFLYTWMSHPPGSRTLGLVLSPCLDSVFSCEVQALCLLGWAQKLALRPVAHSGHRLSLRTEPHGNAAIGARVTHDTFDSRTISTDVWPSQPEIGASYPSADDVGRHLRPWTLA